MIKLHDLESLRRFSSVSFNNIFSMNHDSKEHQVYFRIHIYFFITECDRWVDNSELQMLEL